MRALGAADGCGRADAGEVKRASAAASNALGGMIDMHYGRRGAIVSIRIPPPLR